MLKEITANQQNLKYIVICRHNDNLLRIIEAPGCESPQDSRGAREYDKYFVVTVAGENCSVKTKLY